MGPGAGRRADLGRVMRGVPEPVIALVTVHAMGRLPGWPVTMAPLPARMVSGLI